MRNEVENTKGNLLNEIGQASGFIYLLHYPAVQLGCNSLYLGLPKNYISCFIQIVVIIAISIFVPLILFRMSKES